MKMGLRVPAILVLLAGGGFVSGRGFAAAQAAPPPPPQQSEPPDLFGVYIGMSEQELEQAYGANQSSTGGHIEHSPIYGIYMVPTVLPKEPAGSIIPLTGGLIVKRSIYICDKRVYRVRVEVGGPDGNMMDPETAMNAYLALRNSYSQLFPGTFVTEKVPDGPFSCDGGSGNAQQLVAQHNSAGDWASMPYQDKAILGMNCNVVPDWEADFRVHEHETFTVFLYPDDGGGLYSNIGMSLQYDPTTNYFNHRK